MHTKKIMSYLSLVVMLAMLASLQGCFFLGLPPYEREVPAVPKENNPVSNAYPHPYPGPGNGQVVNPQPEAESNPDQGSNAPVNANPDPEPEAPPPVGEKLVWFRESDCAITGLSGLQVNYGPGVLGCNYSWEGFYSDPNEAIIEITEIPDPERLSSQFESDISGAQNSADSKSTNETLSIIHNDANGFIFASTYLGGPGEQSAENPLCVRGAGYEKVNDRFLVYFRLSICSTSGTHTD